MNAELGSVVRYAIVRNANSRSLAEAYLPGNYAVIWEGPVPAYEGEGPHVTDRLVTGFVIAGRDQAGWTLDDYVIPRYLSGLVGCEEIDLSHPLMKEIPA